MSLPKDAAHEATCRGSKMLRPLLGCVVCLRGASVNGVLAL